MKEKIFLSEEGVSVTWSRIILYDQSYPVSGITSVRTQTKPPNHLGSILLVAFGILFLLASVGGSSVGYLGIGFLLIALAVPVWRSVKPTYSIFLGTAGGERQALSSTDAAYIGRVSKAIDKVLIARSQS